jgi:hypothetical protein
VFKFAVGVFCACARSFVCVDRCVRTRPVGWKCFRVYPASRSSTNLAELAAFFAPFSAWSQLICLSLFSAAMAKVRFSNQAVCVCRSLCVCVRNGWVSVCGRTHVCIR